MTSAAVKRELKLQIEVYSFLMILKLFYNSKHSSIWSWKLIKYVDSVISVNQLELYLLEVKIYAYGLFILKQDKKPYAMKDDTSGR